MPKKKKKPAISPETYHEDDRYMDAAIGGAELANDPDATDCTICKHVHKNGVTCDAFPKEIPNDILFMFVNHMKPYPGDNDIQYELNPKAAKY